MEGYTLALQPHVSPVSPDSDYTVRDLALNNTAGSGLALGGKTPGLRDAKYDIDVLVFFFFFF